MWTELVFRRENIHINNKELFARQNSVLIVQHDDSCTISLMFFAPPALLPDYVIYLRVSCLELCNCSESEQTTALVHFELIICGTNWPPV